jgi:hypothetical protein
MSSTDHNQSHAGKPKIKLVPSSVHLTSNLAQGKSDLAKPGVACPFAVCPSRAYDTETSPGVATSPSVKSDRSDIPSEVKGDPKNGGVEDGALKLAKAFLKDQGQMARKCHKRGELSHLYISTFKSWASETTQDDESAQRPFKQVLFALAHGMKVVRVVERGRRLLWNRYRDNDGNQLERNEHHDRQARGRYERRDRSRSPGRGSRGHNDDHRGSHERYERRGSHERYERRDRHERQDNYRGGGGRSMTKRDDDDGAAGRESRNSRHRQDRHQRREERTCYNCNQVGHIGRDCEQPDRRKQRHQRSRSPSPNYSRQTRSTSPKSPTRETVKLEF